MSGPRCSICLHVQRLAIEAALAEGVAVREVARRFEVGHDAVRRHVKAHMVRAIVPAEPVAPVPVLEPAPVADPPPPAGRIATARAVDLYERLAQAINLVDALQRACERYMPDPDRPGELTLDAQAREVSVIYARPIVGAGGRVQWVPGRAPLQDLVDLVELAQLPNVDGPIRVARLEYKHADPRKLIIALAGRLEAQVRLLGQLLGELSSRDKVSRKVVEDLVAELAAHVEAEVKDAGVLARIAERWASTVKGVG